MVLRKVSLTPSKTTLACIKSTGGTGIDALYIIGKSHRVTHSVGNFRKMSHFACKRRSIFSISYLDIFNSSCSMISSGICPIRPTFSALLFFIIHSCSRWNLWCRRINRFLFKILLTFTTRSSDYRNGNPIRVCRNLSWTFWQWGIFVPTRKSIFEMLTDGVSQQIGPCMVWGKVGKCGAILTYFFSLYLLSECCWVTALLRLKEDFGDKGG